MSRGEQAGRTGPSARNRLLSAAEELFYARGIASVGVDEVVARAGVATASLYTNFAGKDGLVADYLEARHERWRRHWEAHIEQAGEPVERVLAVFVALETWNHEEGPNNGCAHLAALQQLPGDHPAAAVARRHKSHVLELLRRLLADAGFPDVENKATDLLLIYEGTLALGATGQERDPAHRGRRLARQCLDSSRRERVVAEISSGSGSRSPGG